MAERREEGSRSAPSIALGSMVGECLVSVLDDLEAEARLAPEDRKRVLAVFEKAFAEEMARLPRIWTLAVKGNMEGFHLAGQGRLFDITQAEVNTPVASFDQLSLRISGTLQPQATKGRKRKSDMESLDDD